MMNIWLKIIIKTRPTTFIKAKLTKPDRQRNVGKYRVAAHKIMLLPRGNIEFTKYGDTWVFES